jgi:2-polyprenyl-3-methyl-5-hydroxy-6-metoxy-1,4-benzoquinol methylase
VSDGGGADRGADVFAQVAPEGFEIIACPGCGEKLSSVVRQGKDWILNEPLTLTIVRCDSCGLHYLNPRPRMGQIDRYYSSAYPPYLSRGEDGDDARGVKGLALRQAYGAPHRRPTGNQRALARAVLAVKPAESFGFGVPWHGQGRLLDFGCGGGKFIRRMHAVGWDVTGIDFSEKAVQAVRDAGLNALQGTLPHAELTPGSFDVITMRHALEHVPDPRAVLRAARELLAPGGRLVIQVPNFAGWDVEYFGDAAIALDLPIHLTHFTPPTLRAMLEREDLRVLSTRTPSRSNWIRKAAMRSERGPKRTMAWALRWSVVCRAVARVTQVRGLGNEIIAVAERDGETRDNVKNPRDSAALRPGA